MKNGAVRFVGGNKDSNRWLLTTAIGGDYFERWVEQVKPSWDQYAEDHELGIAVVVSDLFEVNEPELNGAWQKLLAPRALRHQLERDVRCALLDTDLIIAPGAASVFEVVPPRQIGVVSQEQGLPLPATEIRNRIALFRRKFLDGSFPLQSILNATPRQVFEWAGLPPHDNYFCTGMFVIDTAVHADALAEAYGAAPEDENYKAIDSWEEVWLNHWVQSREDVAWLDYRWHALWIFEVAAYYPFLYSPQASEEIARWCLTASLLRNEFFHLAGQWESSLLGTPLTEFPSLAETGEVRALMRLVRENDRAVVEGAQRGKISPPIYRSN
jgi:hypothetical protein